MWFWFLAEIGKRNIPAFDKILEILSPLDPPPLLIHLILQLRYRLPDDIRQEIDQPRPWLHLAAVRREGEAMLCHLEECHAQAPNIRSNGVRLPCDTLRRHVVARTNKRIRVPPCAEFARDAEIAELDLAVAAEEDVTGFDIAVDDLSAVEVCQAIQHALGDFPKNLFARAAAEFLDFAVDAVEGTAFTEFHDDADGAAAVVELAIVLANVLAGAFFVEGELALDLLFHVGVGVGSYDLEVAKR